MSWSTPEEVARLIHAARLAASVDSTTRKSADLALLDLFENAINIGDSLVAVAVNPQWPFALRFNAALAVEALFTRQGWREGHKFSDKDLTLVALSQLALDDATASTQVKFHRTVVDCVCAIAVLDFPTDQWQSFISARTQQVMAQASDGARLELVGKSPAWVFLHQLSRLAYRNASLWWHLSAETSRQLLAHGLPPPSSVARLNVMVFLLHLLQRRPRPSEESELATAQNCFLLSSDFSSVVMTQLEQCATVIATRSADASSQGGSGNPPDLLSCEWSLLASLAQRLMRTGEVAAVAFRACAVVLVTLQPAYANDVDVDRLDSAPDCLREAGGAAQNSLECLLNALQTFPDVSTTSRASELLGCLLFYMLDRGDPADVPDTSDLEAALKDLLSDDEMIPLGCDGGDNAAIACSVLELFLDANHTQLFDASVALLDFAKLQLTRASPQPAAWGALARALTSIARVCEAADISFVAALPQEHIVDLLSTFSTALSRQTTALSTCQLLFALSKSFALGGPPIFLSGWHGVLCAVFDAWATHTNVDSATAQYVLGTLLWCVGNVLGSITNAAWLGDTAAEILVQWRSRSVELVCATPSTLLLTCVGNVALQLARATVFSPLSFEAWSSVCEAAVVLCTVKTVSSLLKDILWTCLELEVHAAATAAAPGGGRDAVPDVVDCPRLALLVAKSAESLDPARAALVWRAVSLFIVSLVRAYRHQGTVLRRFDALVYESALALVRLGEEEAASTDEANCRSFVCALAAAVSALPLDATTQLAPSAYDATVRMATSCHAVFCSFTTLHTFGSALSVLAMTYPELLSRPSTTALLNAVFATPDWLSPRRPVAGFTGCTLLLSLFVLQDPSRCLAAVANAASSSCCNSLTPEAFGWWATLATFSDETCVVFFLAACASVLSMASSRDGPAVLATLAQPLARNTVYILPSFRARKPSRIQRTLSVWASLACGLVLVREKWLKATKVPCNEALTLTGDMTHNAWQSLCAALVSAALPAPHASTAATVVEVAVMLIEHLKGRGMADVVAAAEHLVHA